MFERGSRRIDSYRFKIQNCNKMFQKLFGIKPKAPKLGDYENPYLQDGISSLDTVSRACFWLSTISSAICIGYAGYEVSKGYLPAYFYDPANFSSYYGLMLAVGAGSFKVCHLIDFYGIYKFVKLAVAEGVALASGRFEFTLIRIISLGIWSVVAAAFVFISFVTSYKGSDLVRIVSKPKENKAIAQVEKLNSSSAKAISEAVAPFQVRYDAIAKRRDDELKAVGSAELRKLAKDGNEWAISELQTAEKRVRGKYDKELSAADAKLQAALADAKANQDKRDAIVLSSAESISRDYDDQNGAMSIILLCAGVLPLVIGVLLISVEVMTTVVEQIARGDAQAAKGAKK